MKIAIVGGGFYGCYIADILKKKFCSHVNIDIFDRSDSLMTRAVANNQCRLHLGFHYPRSIETIRQTIYGFNQFVDDFGDCIEFPLQNYYVVHRNSHVNFDEYLTAMDENNLKYDIVGSASHCFFRQPKDIEGVIRVGEGVIRLDDLKKNLANRIKTNIQVYCNAIVSAIDAESGSLVSNEKVHEGYDIIINATYTDTNLGLPKEKCFDLKYEITAMVLVDAPFGDDVALTIMDGPFVSLYPAGQGKATLSSVTYTPFLNCNTPADLETQLAKVKKNKILKSVVDNILNHGNELLNLDLAHNQVKSLWIAPKTKVLQDNFDQRLTEIRTHEKLISVLCGKLDAVHHITDQIVEEIKGQTQQMFAGIEEF